eukprot:GCRY01003329.1.p1 GENE.GCRY01003329.1~~GCRY01003329.1.p1  ORF type:complete len:213 (+),score=32.76 GCRY01003329.1:91-729(+)
MFFFTLSDPSFLCYMGKDKYENEDLLKWGWPEDVWFHVDKLSSAHVYLRLPPNMTVDTIPKEIVEECCQLTKANSIEGCKLNGITIVYTEFPNLKKTGDMVTGQVGFHSGKKVRRAVVDKKNREMLNRLNKTKREDYPDLEKLRRKRDQEILRQEKKARRENEIEKKKEMIKKQEEKEQRNYHGLMDDVDKMANLNTAMGEVDYNQFEDDFM